MDDFETLSFSAAERSVAVFLGPGSRFFAGHFPEHPVLPAIAHLMLVHDLVRRCFGKRASIVAVERARWTRPVTPGSRLEIRLVAGNDPLQARFEIDGDGERVCEGLLTWCDEERA